MKPVKSSTNMRSKLKIEDDFLNLTIRAISKLDLKKILEQHLSQPDISLAAHKMARRKIIDGQVAGYKKVYLDTLFWINLRDAVGKSPNRKHEYEQLLAVLKNKVKTGKIICPFSSVLFDELLKQGDLKVRRKTFQIADILTRKFALNPLYHLINCEV